jgi:hypothetical protein
MVRRVRSPTSCVHVRVWVTHSSYLSCSRRDWGRGGNFGISAHSRRLHDEGHEVQVFSPLMRGNVISRGLPPWGVPACMGSCPDRPFSEASCMVLRENHPVRLRGQSQQIPLSPSNHSCVLHAGSAQAQLSLNECLFCIIRRTATSYGGHRSCKLVVHGICQDRGEKSNFGS